MWDESKNRDNLGLGRNIKAIKISLNLKNFSKMRKTPLSLPGFCLWFLLFFLSTNLLYADEPPASSSAEVIEKKTREEAKEELLEKKPVEKVTVEEEKAPPPKKEVSFFVQKINIRGREFIPPNVQKELQDFKIFKPLLKQYTGRQVTLSEFDELNRKLEQELRARGYFALVHTPPQRIEKGEVQIEIILTRMGDLLVEGGRYFRQGKTRSYWGIPKGQVLRFEDIQKSIQAMNENPDRNVRPILRAGAERGTSDAILKVEDQFPVHGSFSLDNQGSRLTGKERKGLILRHNNLLSLDDVFLIGTSFGSEFGALFLQHLLPVTSFGTHLVTGFSHAQVVPKKEFEILGVNGISQTYSVSLRQNLIRSERFVGNAYVGFDFKEKRTRILSVITAWDRLRILSLGGDLQARDKWGVWGLGQDFYFSFSPHGDGFSLTSRQAESTFFKYGFSILRQNKMPLGTKVIAKFQGQVSPDKLPPQEEIIFGGASSVRGYPEGDYLGDQGTLTNLEYWIPFFVIPKSWHLPYDRSPLRDQIQMIGFLDHGYGRLRQPLEGEHRSRRLFGLGGGFQVAYRSHLSARFEWGVPLGDDTLTEGGHSQFHFRFRAEV